MKKYKWGVIGTGWISSKFCEALKLTGRAEITAVCSRDEQRGKAFAEKYGISAVFTDVEKMCAEGDVDIVYVGTTNQMHLENAMTAIENNKHVLCEKPMTLNLAQSKEIIEAAAEKGVFLMEAMWVRFLPAVQKAMQWVSEGRIGRVSEVKSSFHCDSPVETANERLYKRELGGGSMLDLGVYTYAASTFFLGGVKSVPFTEAKLSESGVDVFDTAILECEKGNAFMTCGFDRVSNNAVIEGSEGFIVIPNWCGCSSAYLYRNGEGLVDSFSHEMNNGMEYEAIHVMECLDKGETQSPLYPLSATVEEMRWLDHLREKWGVEYPNEHESYKSKSAVSGFDAPAEGAVQLNTVPDWYRDASFYHIYPLGMCGAPASNDFSSEPVNRLDKITRMVGHITASGFNAVYFGPLFESSNHGYDTADYSKIDRRLGTNADFARLCSELHSRGIRVVVDGVFNHVGRDFWAFKDVKEKRWESKYKDWFHINFDGNSNYNDGFWYEGWEGHFELVKLNLHNPEVREHIYNCIRGWVSQFGIDGLRLDVAYLLDKNFLRELCSVCRSIKPDFFMLGECIHGDYSQLVNDSLLDSVTNYECYKGLHSSINSGNMHEIGYSLHRQFGPEHWCIYKGMSLYTFVDNHDVSRIASVLGDNNLLPVAYALMFSMPGIPSVYYGSELGMRGDKSNGDAALRTELTIDDVKRMRNSLTDYIARLCRARQQSVALRRGDYHQLYVNSHQLVFSRSCDGERVICAFNTSEQPHTAHFDAGAGRALDLITGRTIDFGGGLELPPKSAYIGKVY